MDNVLTVYFRLQALAALGYISTVPAKPNELKYKVGDRIQISLNNKTVEATINAIERRTDGLGLQISYGHKSNGADSRVAGCETVKEPLTFVNLRFCIFPTFLRFV